MGEQKKIPGNLREKIKDLVLDSKYYADMDDVVDDLYSLLNIHSHDPNMILAYIHTLEFLAFVKISLFDKTEGDSNFNKIKDFFIKNTLERFDISLPYLLFEIDRYPGFNWSQVIAENPHFATEARSAIKRNRPDIKSIFDEAIH